MYIHFLKALSSHKDGRDEIIISFMKRGKTNFPFKYVEWMNTGPTRVKNVWKFVCER